MNLVLTHRSCVTSNGNSWCISYYLKEVGDVGLARSNASPVLRAVLRFIPVLEDEGCRVNKEEIRNLYKFFWGNKFKIVNTLKFTRASLFSQQFSLSYISNFDETVDVQPFFFALTCVNYKGLHADPLVVEVAKYGAQLHKSVASVVMVAKNCMIDGLN